MLVFAPTESRRKKKLWSEMKTSEHKLCPQPKVACWLFGPFGIIYATMLYIISPTFVVVSAFRELHVLWRFNWEMESRNRHQQNVFAPITKHEPHLRRSRKRSLVQPCWQKLRDNFHIFVLISLCFYFCELHKNSLRLHPAQQFSEFDLHITNIFSALGSSFGLHKMHLFEFVSPVLAPIFLSQQRKKNVTLWWWWLGFSGWWSVRRSRGEIGLGWHKEEDYRSVFMCSRF